MSSAGGRRATGLADVHRFDEALALVPTNQGRIDRWLRRLILFGARVAGWRLRIDRASDLPSRSGLPAGGCVVVVAPHRAWVEPLLLVAAWPPGAAHLVWLADGPTATRSWWRRRLLPRLGVIPIVGGVAGLALAWSINRALPRSRNWRHRLRMELAPEGACVQSLQTLR